MYIYLFQLVNKTVYGYNWTQRGFKMTIFLVLQDRYGVTVKNL